MSEMDPVEVETKPDTDPEDQDTNPSSGESRRVAGVDGTEIHQDSAQSFKMEIDPKIGPTPNDSTSIPIRIDTDKLNLDQSKVSLVNSDKVKEKDEIRKNKDKPQPSTSTVTTTPTTITKRLSSEELLSLCKTSSVSVVLTQFKFPTPNPPGQLQTININANPGTEEVTPPTATDQETSPENSLPSVQLDSGIDMLSATSELLPLKSEDVPLVPIMINSEENHPTTTSLASSCPNVMAALMNPSPSTMGRTAPSSFSSSTSSNTVIPGTKDSDGFLTPPPASTLLIRRTRTNSTGSSTYVISSPTRKPPETVPVPPPTAMESLLLQRRQCRKSDSSRSGRSIKRPKFDDERVEFSSNTATSTSGPGVSYVTHSHTHSSLHSRGYLPPISPLAIDPTHSLSVTISSDRSVATHISPSSPQTEPIFNSINSFPSTSTANSVNPSSISSIFPSFTNSSSMIPQSIPSTSTSALVSDLRNSKPKVSRGKPAYITENYNGGKGSKKRRSFERSASLDSARKRSARRRQRLSTENKYSRSNRGSRSYSESSMGCELDQGGSWRPADDLRLIINVLQTNDLELVYRGVKFSCKYTLENITARWQLLLYDKPTSKVSQLAIRNLHPKTVAAIYSQALFSKDEDNLLKTIKSTHDPKIVPPKIEKLLSENALVFLKWRTPKKLFDHWLLLREYYMLSDQDVGEYFAQESFSDFENSLSDDECKNNIEIDGHVRREAIIENRQAKKKIRILEEEVAKWEILANMVTEIEPRPFEESSYAMLRGKQVRYLMRSKEITLGRRTSESMNVDAELSMEGSTYKVSRKQATIQLRTMGDFAILNQGKHAIYVDGNAVSPGQLWRLVDQSVIEISRLRFVFLINHKMVANYRRRQIKSEVRKEMMDLSKLARAIKATSSGVGLGLRGSPSSN